MESFINWFDMNGYAAWVWSAYALWALAFAWLLFSTLSGRKRVWVQLHEQQRRKQLKAGQKTTSQQDDSELS